MTNSSLGSRRWLRVDTSPRIVQLFMLAALTASVPLGAPAARAEDRVYADSESVEPLAPGAKIPTAVVRTVDGKPMDLSATIGEGGALLVFYRGGW